MNLITSLYKIKLEFPEADISGAPEGTRLAVNVTGPSGIGKSELNPGKQSRFSNILPAVKNIISGSVDVLAVPCLHGAVYVEMGDQCMVVDSRTIMAKETATPKDVLYAYIAYLLGTSDPDTKEFKSVYSEVANDLKTTGKIPFEKALKICDSAYYTGKKMLQPDPKTGAPSLEEGEDLTYESVKELSRFNSGTQPIDFQEILPKKRESKYWDFSESPESKPISPATSSSVSVYERAKAGEYIIPWEWDEESKKQIPDISFLDLYIPSEDFEDALLLMYKNANRILGNIDMGYTGAEAIGNNGKGYAFIGKPGTGKSTMAKALCAAFQIPFYPCTTTRYSEEDEYQGKTKISHEEKSSASFKFYETPFLRGFKNGGLVVLEEFNIADAGMLMGAIGQAIEKPFIIEEDGFKQVTRNPLCFIAFTCNVGTQGSQSPNEALFSRTPHVFNIEDPTEKEFVKILMKQSEDADEFTVKKVYQTYKKILNWFQTEGLPEMAKVLTLRHCLAAIEEVTSGINFKRAITRTMVNPIKVYAPDLVEDIMTIVKTMV